MSFDSLVTNPGRLRILTALASCGTQEFVDLRAQTKLSDGNLSSHARRLQQAGLITIYKQIREGKPVTRFDLNREGREALEAHAQQLLLALGSGTPTLARSTETVSSSVMRDEEWVD
jgi:DNA-binding MarR family transcriptional regulator